MWGRRIAYLLILLVCFFGYLIFQVWFSLVLLLTVAVLPILSLVLSLPAMLTATAVFHVPPQGRVNVPTRTSLQVDCRFPVPPVKCRIRLHNLLTGHRYIGHPGEYLPVQHSGVLKITVTHLWVCDYLGIFRRDLRPNRVYTMSIMPKPVADTMDAVGEEGFGNGWRPKAGGFAENHELRLYRPGDDLRLLHFKMSAKTGKLIYREPVVQQHFRVCLALTLSGKPAVLDDKLGRLLYLSHRLLQDHIPHEIRCRSGLGDHSYRIVGKDSQQAVLREIMSCPATVGEWDPEGIVADRLYKIGGAP